MHDDEEALRFDIGFIVKRLVTWPARRRDMDDRTRNAIAAEIVKHLKLARWRFHREPPAPWHSTPGPRP
jgi:hypothetical protein